MKINRRTDLRAYRQADRQTEKQPDIKIERHTGRQTDRTGNQTARQLIVNLMLAPAVSGTLIKVVFFLTFYVRGICQWHAQIHHSQVWGTCKQNTNILLLKC
jgi:hypothetical protein